MLFVVSVIVQNAVRAGYPRADASAAKVVAYYAVHHSGALALAAMLPFGLLGLGAFVGAMMARAAHGKGRGSAFAGLFGAAGIMGTFLMVSATDFAIDAYVGRGDPDLSVVSGMWVLHNAVFGVLLGAIGVALAGLTIACAESGVLHARWRVAGLLGGLALLVAAGTTPAIVDGGPTMFVGLAGFVVWVVFLVAASIRLLHGR